MKNRIIRRINSYGRISLTKEFCSYVEISVPNKVAVCKGLRDKEIYILDIAKVKDDELIAFATIDNKSRLFIPKILREGSDEFFEISIINKKIFLKAI